MQRRRTKSFPSWERMRTLFLGTAAFITIVSSFLTSAGFAQTEDQSASSTLPGVEYNAQTDQLKVSVTGASFTRVMEAVAEKTGHNIIVEEGTESVLTVDFGFLPFEEALLQLLKGKNYALFRSNDGSRIATVRVLANPAAGEPTFHPTTQPNQPPKAPTLPPLPLQALGEVPEEQVKTVLSMLKQREAATGADMRAGTQGDACDS